MHAENSPPATAINPTLWRHSVNEIITGLPGGRHKNRAAEGGFYRRVTRGRRCSRRLDRRPSFVGSVVGAVGSCGRW